jgi:hypothetical protein
MELYELVVLGSRHSPRKQFVARALDQARIGRLPGRLPRSPTCRLVTSVPVATRRLTSE